jgi:hypothetical protein
VIQITKLDERKIIQVIDLIADAAFITETAIFAVCFVV